MSTATATNPNATTKKPPTGALRLLFTKDRYAASAAFPDKPLVSWKTTSLGDGSVFNPAGWGLLRVVTQRIVNGEAKDAYDQAIMVENAGAIVVCESAGKVGLVQNFRFVAERLMNAGKDYVKKLDEEKRWGELLATLGQWQWELPRGMSTVESETDLGKFVVATAKVEAFEESGFVIEDARICGKCNPNSTFFAHSQYVVSGRVAATKPNCPEPSELLGATRLFSGEEIRRLANEGELQDGLTFAALALAGFRF